MEDFEQLHGSLLGWALAKTKWVKQRDYPPSLEEMKGNRARLQDYLTKELPVKTQEKAQLAEMEGILKVWVWCVCVRACMCACVCVCVRVCVVIALMCKRLNNFLFSFKSVLCICMVVSQ